MVPTDPGPPSQNAAPLAEVGHNFVPDVATILYRHMEVHIVMDHQTKPDRAVIKNVQVGAQYLINKEVLCFETSRQSSIPNRRVSRWIARKTRCQLLQSAFQL